uniref:PX domain-containing protein n=1 Tax=Noctiluca scintillans TaxID=2966 RepID=A0A7S1FA64_NOCSC|mmetsp:Transcript_44058/g.116522  ORF Transcript_44058/g.116522 Transcript_44058/m.116522 type:complete len:247 (+) Transcript_44058:80-820(+)|eukprot:CAMPEP_0194492080 /NCGR_PEP_ID=MMETSP0253-20130528/10758_1 /TAXON_ID=2966 /ORGANISM="Noctiluca scintillans" /LENGTH=246 /DNA_ID=CAMNT_0039332897 /DNA_START=75 /DNA_END=815 /DNA_ORIENTATION=-
MSAGERYTLQLAGNTSADGHTIYTIKVTSPDGDTWTIQKRYSEIRELHDQLRLRHGANLEAFPGKRLFGNQDPAFVKERQTGLQRYLDGVLRLEKDIRTPALFEFLGGPQPHGERNQAREHQKILTDMQNKLLNLALPPAPLDETEMGQRLKKYCQAMRLFVLSQPVDPIHLRAPGFDGEPLQLCASNSEKFDLLKQPPTGDMDEPLLGGLLDQLHQVLRPDMPIGDPEKLIVPFPKITLPASTAP